MNNPINQVIANQDVHALTQKKPIYKNGLQKLATKTGCKKRAPKNVLQKTGYKKRATKKRATKNGLQKGISEFVRGDCKPKAKVYSV